MITQNLIGWSLLISSWIIPRFIKDPENKKAVGASLAAMAAGFFLARLI
jgi:hypothetical protein